MATTVHECQVLDAGRIPVTDHDVPVDLIATPERTITCHRGRRQWPDLPWEGLTKEKVGAVAVLQRLRAAGRGPAS